MEVRLLLGTKEEDIKARTKIVASAGWLSRTPGDVFEVFAQDRGFEKDKTFAGNVIKMGHESISEHDYLVFAIKDVSPVVEQILIEERIVSFTIKSRREADFSKVGYYEPKFRDENYDVLGNNTALSRLYQEHMKYLFTSYSELIQMGLKKEDARFILPYSFHSNIIMGCDARVLKSLIIRFTRGKESKIAELREFGEKLYDIMCKYVPYYKEAIDAATIPESDKVKEFFKGYQAPSVSDCAKVTMTNCPSDADKSILISAIKRIYNCTDASAIEFYNNNLAGNIEAQRNLMQAILLNGGDEFSQVSFGFDVPISLASLTHLTRHRTHNLIIPDFVPIRDLNNYCEPPKLTDEMKAKFAEIYAKNYELYSKFKSAGVCEEDLVYFYLAGTMFNVATNIDGKSFAHIARLRICNKAQWEIRNILIAMRALVMEVAPIYGNLLGPDCEIYGECHEGRECCGRVHTIKNPKVTTKGE